MTRDILLTAGVVLAAAILILIGIALGRWSRRDEIDTLDYRIDQQATTIGERIADVAAGEKAHAEIAADLARERDVTAHLRGLLAERKIGANPIWSQLHAVQPPPIPDEWLRWEGSKAGQTGAWRTVPGEAVGRAVELLDARTRPQRPVDTALSDTGTFTIAEVPDVSAALDAAIERYAARRRVVIELGEEDVVTQAVAVRRGGPVLPRRDYPAKPRRHGKGKR